MNAQELNKHFFNIADTYIGYHRKIQPDMEEILTLLESVPEEDRDKAWARDLDLITDIFEKERDFTMAVQAMIIAKNDAYEAKAATRG